MLRNRVKPVATCESHFFHHAPSSRGVPCYAPEGSAKGAKQANVTGLGLNAVSQCAATGATSPPALRRDSCEPARSWGATPSATPTFRVRSHTRSSSPPHDLTTSRSHLSPFSLSPGTPADLAALAHHHYLSTPPGPIAQILTIHDRAARTLVAVLVITRPTPNGAWRNLAWPGDYSGPDKREALCRLNADVRTIARVIVEPRYRGLGLASSLVRAYLASPLTPRTEALAAMGAHAPFFLSAGMTAHRLPRAKGEARLLRALTVRALRPADLWDEVTFAALMRDRAFHAELRAWAMWRGALRHLVDAPPEAILSRARRSLGRVRIAFTHDARTIEGAHDPPRAKCVRL